MRFREKLSEPALIRHVACSIVKAAWTLARWHYSEPKGTHTWTFRIRQRVYTLSLSSDVCDEEGVSHAG